jgi:hypothetical protein
MKKEIEQMQAAMLDWEQTPQSAYLFSSVIKSRIVFLRLCFPTSRYAQSSWKTFQETGRFQSTERKRTFRTKIYQPPVE